MGTPSYEGKQVYMGLDVHREFFVASCICDGVVVKRCRMPGTAEAVISLVSKEFGGASVRAKEDDAHLSFTFGALERIHLVDSLYARGPTFMCDGSRGTRKSFAVYNHGSGDLHPLVYTPDGPEKGDCL